MARLAESLEAMRGHRAPTYGKVAVVDGGGTSRGTSCEGVVLDRALRDLAEAASRDPRIAAARDRLEERLLGLAAAVRPRAEYAVVHGDPGPQRQVVLGQDAAEQVHPLALRKARGLADHGAGQSKAAGELRGHAPQQEGPDGVAAVFGVLDVPGVDVGLAAGGQGEVTVGKPVEEACGVVDLLAGIAAARRG